MGTVLNSIDNIIASSEDNGPFTRFYYSTIGTATTAATTSSGYVNAQRFPNPLTMLSSFGAGITGAVFPYVRCMSDDPDSHFICGIEYDMGTLTISGNSFADGVAMPTKVVRGTSLQTASQIAFLVVNSTLTATTPVITITYTDQGGTTSNTATLTLPTNPVVNSSFLITPHLASGDTGIRDITNMSTNVGTGGILKIYGLLILNIVGNQAAFTCHAEDPLTVPHIMWKVEAS